MMSDLILINNCKLYFIVIYQIFVIMIVMSNESIKIIIKLYHETLKLNTISLIFPVETSFSKYKT